MGYQLHITHLIRTVRIAEAAAVNSIWVYRYHNRGSTATQYMQRSRLREVLKAFYERHPERFVRGVPLPPEQPGEVWINKPKPDQQAA